MKNSFEEEQFIGLVFMLFILIIFNSGFDHQNDLNAGRHAE